MAVQTPQIRGYHAYYQSPRALPRLFAIWCDATLLVILFCGLTYRLSPSFFPQWGTLSLSIFCFLGLQIPLLFFKGATLGEWIWGQKRLTQEKEAINLELSPKKYLESLKKSRLYQKNYFTLAQKIWAFILTLAVIGTSSFLIDSVLLQHPLAQTLTLIQTQALSPEEVIALEKEHGATLVAYPLFYSVGFWPTQLGGKPIYYQLPYQKGPPSQFIGQISARWNSDPKRPNSESRFTAEGPRTPLELSERNPEVLKNCFTVAFNYSCLTLKEKTLSRHLEDISKKLNTRLSPKQLTLSWTEIKHPTGETFNGILLEASLPNLIHTRFIWITPEGTHQAFYLDSPNNSEGKKAKTLFMALLRTQTLTPMIEMARDKINSKLSQADLNLASSQTPAQLSELHAYLFSKISVDPGSFDTYFHLSGSTFLLFKKAKELGDETLSALALPLLKSLTQYAKDVSPTDNRNYQLQQMLLEIQRK